MTNARDVRGTARLVVDATLGLSSVVEELHSVIARSAAVPDTPIHAATRAVTAAVYSTVRGTTWSVGKVLDAVLARMPRSQGSPCSASRAALVAALNGVVGDHLAATGNPLAIPMHLHAQGRELTCGAPIDGATGRLLVLVHGLCMTDRQWTREGHDHGGALARDLGFTPVYLHYNSGRHVSTNGRALAMLLEDLLAAWPVELRQVAILGHSLGGLVARSACHWGGWLRHRWRRQLASLVFLGTPHHGAPLERAGHGIDVLLRATRFTAPLARLGQARSAGITDLRHGSAVPLPRDVAAFAVAGTRSRAGAARALPGDGLVPVASALGVHPHRGRSLRIPRARRFVAAGTGHLGLLSSSLVYERLRSWLSKGDARVSRVRAVPRPSRRG